MIAATKKLDECWLAHYLNEFYPKEPTHSVADNPRKNSLAYHVVQAEKSEFLRDAAAIAPRMCDVFCWIDFGIFSVPGVTLQVIREFLVRAQDEQAIAIPGCWSDDYVYDDNNPCWRWCGGVLVVPKRYVSDLDAAMKREYVNWLHRTNNISWEINVLSRIERQGTDLPLWHYVADHNETLFTNYRQTEFADERRSQPYRGGRQPHQAF